MKAISLCSGADGFGLAASLLGIEVVAHVEIERKFDEHYKTHWPNAKRFYDLTTVNPEELPDAEFIFGGEPCQGNSSAGLKKGKADHRYLWPDYFRICEAKHPDWIINENVIGSVRNMVLDTKVNDLESIGYTCGIYNIPACAVGANHERQRIWLVANSNSQRFAINENSLRERRPHADTVKKRLSVKEQQKEQVPRLLSGKFSHRIYPTPFSGIHQVVNDVPTELAEIKAYGNAVVPWIPYVILKFILEIERTL